MRIFRNLRFVAIALAVLTIVGMAGFHFIEGWPWFDGLYMVVTTFTTIGYQEVHPLSHAGRIFNLVLIVSGVSLVFLGIGTLTTCGKRREKTRESPQKPGIKRALVLDSA